ncbi:flagellar basal-body MS-ring/collar protein FliF [Parasphingorhabdus cellanae]|uniref:Flagellar M-ring protein n=1 Tax=Parasphingorhabdus cellanae TaxID=2806553 RepID=A0ABX7T6R3_9SPHN|nr:flagellar basal-body MS-ring/collar protein FliF [Parasphingorhabdus cellanae]QTD56482.1 flagellar M-ring protein FliF [Parasphingorhabdus cellanae]
MNELSLTSDQQVDKPAQELAPLWSTKNSTGTADWRDRLQALVKQPAVARALPWLALLAVVVLAATLWLALREPPQRELFRGLPETEKAAVVEALKQSNIGYDIDASTGTLTVSEDDYHRARLTLAGQSLPKTAPDGDSLISSMPMGASRAVENEKLRAARELDLARTIEAMDNIGSARVHLAVEAPSIFVRDRSEPSASVMLTLVSGNRLGEAQVQSIIYLVASSVPGLSADAVSVVDQNGRLMSRHGSSSASDQAEQHLMVQGQVEDRYRRTITSLLTPMIGADNFTTEVTAEMDFSENQATRESFPPEDARVRTEQGSWSNEPGERASYGIPGALANRPPEEPELTDEFQGDDAAETEETSRTSEKFARQFELGREVSVTKQAVGSLKRLSVAVALRSPMGKNQRSAQELAAVEALVKGAIGFQAERGDVVAIEARTFLPVEETVENWWETNWVSLVARNVSALLVALALIFGLGRPLLKKIRTNKSNLSDTEQMQLASDIDEELNRELAAANKPADLVSLDMISSANGYAERAALIQNFVRQNPDHAALTVQDLLADVHTNRDVQKDVANG